MHFDKAQYFFTIDSKHKWWHVKCLNFMTNLRQHKFICHCLFWKCSCTWLVIYLMPRNVTKIWQDALLKRPSRYKWCERVNYDFLRGLWKLIFSSLSSHCASLNTSRGMSKGVSFNFLSFCLVVFCTRGRVSSCILRRGRSSQFSKPYWVQRSWVSLHL